ncbi:MAG: 50S ribosomal protein L9, partial [Eggerthella lenta]
EENRLADAGKIKETLDGALVKVEAKVGEEGQLFGSVTAQMIADAIKAATDVDVDRRRIELGHAIKTAGQHEVTISLYRDIKTTVKLFVGGADDEVVPAEAEVVERRSRKSSRLPPRRPPRPLNSSSGGIRSISRQRPNGRSRSETPPFTAREGVSSFRKGGAVLSGMFHVKHPSVRRRTAEAVARGASVALRYAAEASGNSGRPRATSVVS